MNFVDSGALVFLKADLWFLALFLAFCQVGQAALGRVYLDRTRPGGEALGLIFSTACGLFIFSLWMAVCAFFFFLNVLSVCAYLAVAGLIFLRSRKALPIPTIVWPVEWTSRVLICVGSFLGLITFVASHAPEFGNDSLAYHLYFPRLYVEAGGLVHEMSHPRSLWPSMMGLLFSAGLLLQGVALAKLLSWLTAMLAILAPVATAAYLTGRRPRVLITALLMFSVPAFWMQSFYAYTDHAMMLFTWLFFVAMWVWRERGYPWRQAFYPGIFASALLSLKYYALVGFLMTGVLLVFWVAMDAKRGKRVSPRPLFALLAAVIAMSGFWYLRSWSLTGNPVFPFAPELFDGNGFSQRMVGFSVLGKSWRDLLCLPWNLSSKPEVFGGEPLGSFFLLVIPFLFYWKKIESFAKYSIVFGMIYVGVWFYTIQHARFMFTAMPFLIYGCAALMAQWVPVDPAFKKTLKALLILAAGLQIVWGAYYPAKIIPGASGSVPAAEYLKDHERSFAIYQKISPYLNKDDVLLSLSEPRLFYSPCRVILYNPTIRWLCDREGLDFGDWLKRERVTRMLSVSRSSVGFRAESEVADLKSELLTQGSVDVEGARYFYELRKLFL